MCIFSNLLILSTPLWVVVSLRPTQVDPAAPSLKSIVLSIPVVCTTLLSCFAASVSASSRSIYFIEFENVLVVDLCAWFHSPNWNAMVFPIFPPILPNHSQSFQYVSNPSAFCSQTVWNCWSSYGCFHSSIRTMRECFGVTQRPTKLLTRVDLQPEVEKPGHVALKAHIAKFAIDNAIMMTHSNSGTCVIISIVICVQPQHICRMLWGFSHCIGRTYAFSQWYYILISSDLIQNPVYFPSLIHIISYAHRFLMFCLSW
jgi:hypothetical protein